MVMVDRDFCEDLAEASPAFHRARAEQVGPKGDCEPMGSMCWSRVLCLWPHGKRSPQWSRFAGRTCDSVDDPGWSSSLITVAHGKETHVGGVCEGLCQEDPMLEQV